MTKGLTTALMACTMVATARGQAPVVNVDVGDGSSPAYSGQGALPDPGNNFWNGINSSAANLIASDGTTVTPISVNVVAGGGFHYGNANGVLADYQFMSAFNGSLAGEITIAGLQPNTEYLVYVYSAGDNPEQGGIITLNGLRGTTGGSSSDQFIEGLNYFVFDIMSDVNGAIEGDWQGFESSAAINGFQITEGSLPRRVQAALGAESPQVHSPGDVVSVDLLFNDAVTLSAAGGAEIQLDLGGTLVTGVHSGDTNGTSLTFEWTAAAVTTVEVKVVANSLQLVGGATLRDSDQTDLVLLHDEFPLPSHQISKQGLSVYPMMDPGLASPHYEFRVREVGGPWQPSFAHFTKCIDNPSAGVEPPYGYYNQAIGGWSHSYCNFEMANNVPVEVEITRVDGSGGQIDISKAVPHPRRKVKGWRVENGRAYVTFDRPTLFAVDIDGQMDENVTPSTDFLNETAIHAVSIFANPFILDKPDLTDPSVLAVEPGTVPPDTGPWTTLYFKPGVHDLFPGATWAPGDAFRLHAGKSYYIPGDAVVHGNMNNGQDSNDARGIRIFGHGTLSCEKIDHPVMFDIPVDDRWISRPIHISSNAKGCRIEGITITDSAHHSCEVKSGFNADPADFNYLRWCKTITWRANGDGISPNGSSFLEDCFLRTQDDGTYVLGLGIRRIVYWSDANGMPLRCSNMVAGNEAPYGEKLYVEDIDVIYARSAFGSSPGRSIIGYPDPAASFPGSNGSHVVFRDINVEDPLPARRLFGWDIQAGDTAVSSVRFENVRAVAQNVDGDSEIFLGGLLAPIEGLVFDNVTLAGEHFDSAADFELNANVTGLGFENTAPEILTYEDSSGYGKWYLNDDWSSRVEPANNDVVQHTAVGEILTVDALAYAGSLTIGHPDTATVAIEVGGHLAVTNSLDIGGGAAGALRLNGGTLRIDDAASTALTIGTGVLHLERGRLRWAGDHVADLRALFVAGSISISNGRRSKAIPSRPDFVGRSGSSLLFARFNGTTGYTSAWVIELGLPQPR